MATERRPHGKEEADIGSKKRGRAVKRRSVEPENGEGAKRKRTFEDFFSFCSFVLAYEEELERQAMSGTSGPLTPPLPSSPSHLTPPLPSSPSHPHHSNGSSGSSDSGEGEEEEGEGERREVEGGRREGEGVRGGEALPLTPPPEDTHDKLEYTSEDESWNLVTCFCRRPFAGRPMIECSLCRTWVHLFCAKIRKDEVPDVFLCPTCRSQRGRGGEGGGTSKEGEEKGLQRLLMSLVTLTPHPSHSSPLTLLTLQPSPLTFYSLSPSHYNFH